MGCAPSVKKVSPSPTERNSINTVTANGIKSHENGLNGMSNGTNGINGTNEMNGTNGTNFDTNYSKFKNEPSLLSRQSTNPFENESEEDDDLDDSYVNGELDKYFDDGTDENDIKETSDYYDDHQNHMESNGKDINTEGGPQPTAPQQEAIEQEAATRIQAYYRGYNSRRNNNQQEQDEQEEVKPIDITNSQSQDNQGQRIIENEKMDQNEKKSESTDKDPVNKAATTIQAGYKGYKVRKEIKKDGKSSDEGSPVKQSTGQQDIDAEIADIDLNDPEVEKAATKIQATFRGFKSRREPNTESQSKN